jgi:CRP/FNR family transcriptional regulator
MASKIEFLKSIPYFSGLSLAELESVSKLIFEKSYDRGETIFLEGETAEALYLVVSGVVKIFKTSADGKEQILVIVRPGEPFGDVPIFDGGLTPASTQAMTPVLLYGMKKRDLDTILKEHPQVALNIIKSIANRLRHLMSLVEDLSFKHVIGRVARILLERIEDDQAPGPRLTQQDMAAMAGAAREVVSRSLKALEEEGVIKLDRHRIVITDKDALKKMAGPSF